NNTVLLTISIKLIYCYFTLTILLFYQATRFSILLLDKADIPKYQNLKESFSIMIELVSNEI
ncbi:MAG TPA: hypothetical protein VHA52_09300, partial [Candidatus Babeliaceae bacterium]|nr:hypothetical protein [Candidatus Babeliaceae bacterium]